MKQETPAVTVIFLGLVSLYEGVTSTDYHMFPRMKASVFKFRKKLPSEPLWERQISKPLKYKKL